MLLFGSPDATVMAFHATTESHVSRHIPLAGFLLVSLAAVSTAAPPASQPDNPGEEHIMIPMRDGKRLSAYLYRPKGKGPWPVVFQQRYAKLSGTRAQSEPLVRAGYAVAHVNFRGTHLSEGQWVGYRALGWGELKDGYDICEWLAAQSWCNGKVGTFGGSQAGYAQNFLAITRPPHLVCQYMTDTGLSLFQEGYRIGGVTRPRRFFAMDANCREPADNRKLMAEWFRHPNFDEYWHAEDCSRHFDRMDVPCLTVGSWFDFMNQGSIASFRGRQVQGGPNSRGKQYLVIGPWLHGGTKGNKIGELTFPENAAMPAEASMVRWFDHWLKGIDNGIERDPPVRYYVMGANVWRTAKTFPPESTATSYYLNSSKLMEEAPSKNAGETHYTSDPTNPLKLEGPGFPGARDARAFETQADVPTFTTEPLKDAVEWTGRVRTEIYLTSTAKDTDVLVRVSDVYPDGRSILLIDYPLRARYREGFDKEVLMEPGKVHKLAFDVGWLSQVFEKGHRIRVTVSSPGSPLYDPNPQTGKPASIDDPVDPVKADIAIQHNRINASRIIAPVVK